MLNLFIITLLLCPAIVLSQSHQGMVPVGQNEKVSPEDGLGQVDHPVSTRNVEAQKFFSEGLAYLYAFNHEESIRSFRHSAELDPEIAMNYWGIALALGSNYNISADTVQLSEAYSNLKKAIDLAPKASLAERDYISALSKRYDKDPKADQQSLAVSYKNAMGDLARKYPDDLDAATLYAESMMNLRPWQLWAPDGKPADGTFEILSILEGVLKRNPDHTGANHYYIHAIEGSPYPERGLAAAMRLAGLAPNAGHLVHMPSHIYLRTGNYEEAIKSNELAIEADRNYMKKTGSGGVYTLMYYNHNIHVLAAAYAARGNFEGAERAASELETNIRPNIKLMPMLELYLPYKLVTLVRFQKWDRVLKYPQPDADMVVTTGFWRLARGLAYSEMKRTEEAEVELSSLRQLGRNIRADAGFGNNPAAPLFTIADQLLTGEIALTRGDQKVGIESLRRAVIAEDQIIYDEPSDWDLPTRDWLGRALLKSGDYVGAEVVYREAIAKRPRDGRSLFGLAEALNKQGKTSSASLVKKEFDKAWTGSDTKLTTDVFYR